MTTVVIGELFRKYSILKQRYIQQLEHLKTYTYKLSLFGDSLREIPVSRFIYQDNIEIIRCICAIRFNTIKKIIMNDFIARLKFKFININEYAKV